MFGSARKRGMPPDFTELAQIIASHKAPMEELPANRALWDRPAAPPEPPAWAPKKAGIFDFIMTGPLGYREKNDAWRKFQMEQQGQQDIQGLLKSATELGNPKAAIIEAGKTNPRLAGMALETLMKGPSYRTVSEGGVVFNDDTGKVAYTAPRAPRYMSTPDGIVNTDLLGTTTDPLAYKNTSKNTAGKPSLPELRQWGNSYNDDIRAITGNMGNLRNSVTYASDVIANRGNPPPGENVRLSDTRLLRAAARADTGPGVLTEGEVFGTLSPSLQQEIRRQGAYFDASRVVLTPQDRLALAQNVMNGTRSTANDLWTRYEAAAGQLEEAGVTLKEAGITPPEFPHPDDMPALNSPRGQYKVGNPYQGPSGRIYRYDGPGRWKFQGMGQPKAPAPGAGTGMKPRITTRAEYDALPPGTEYIDSAGNPARKKGP